MGQLESIFERGEEGQEEAGEGMAAEEMQKAKERPKSLMVS